jgi:hypothetical protein
VLLSFSTGYKKSFEILREKCVGQRKKNLTPKLREFPKSFDFSTPFQGQKEENAHAGALHNEAIADDDLLSIKPPSTKTPEKNCTKLLRFSTCCKKSPSERERKRINSLCAKP